MKDPNIRKLIDRCLEIDAGLKTIQKALVFDEDDSDSFENTHLWIIERLIAANWENHNAADQLSIQEFRHNLDEEN